MEVPYVDSDTNIKFTEDGRIDKAYIFKIVRDKCEKIYTKSKEPTYVTDVPALGGKVEITGDGIKHGFQDGQKSVSAEITARAELMLPKILKNSIEVNRKGGRDSETSYSSVLLGAVAMQNDNGEIELYAVRSVVEMGKNKTPALIEYGVVGSRYAANAKTADIDHDWFVDDTSPRPVRRLHKVSISQLLRSVKGVFDDTLSEDVYEHFGVNRRKSDFSEGLRYSLPGNNKLDTEYLELAREPEKNEESPVKMAKDNNIYRYKNGAAAFLLQHLFCLITVEEAQTCSLRPKLF